MSEAPPVISVSLGPAELPVDHEHRASCSVRAKNHGPQRRQLGFKLTGEPAAWAWVTPATLTLDAGGEGLVNAVFRPPRAPLPPAGPLPFGLEVTTVGSDEAPVVARGTLQVGAFSDVFATIEPPTSSGTRSGHHTIVLENRGNAPMVARLEGMGEDGLSVEIDPRDVQAASGERTEAKVSVRPARSFHRGPQRAHPFRILAHIDGAGSVTVAATMSQQAFTPLWLRRLAVAIALVLMMAALANATVLSPDPDVADTAAGVADDVAADVQSGASAECPAEGHIGSAVHGSAPEAPPAPGYAFLFADQEGCEPVRFNPCEPLHYVINDDVAPPGGVDDVQEAIARVAEATGITFVDDGRTDEGPTQRRSPYQPERYGERWAPILIGWSKLGTGQGPDVAGDDIIVAGRGRPLRVDDVLVSGVLELNADVILDRETQERLPGGFGEGITRGRVILHELGHVMGLGHPASPAQLMYAELAEHTSSSAQFGVGDLIGLRLVGREAGCVTPPPLPEG